MNCYMAFLTIVNITLSYFNLCLLKRAIVHTEATVIQCSLVLLFRSDKRDFQQQQFLQGEKKLSNIKRAGQLLCGHFVN